MNIRFKNLKITNFLSIGNAELNLQSCGYTLVSGINNNKDDLAKSNGSGKSSIWESIIWALCGETIRGTKNVVNRFTDGGARVEIEFSIDKDSYKIIRTKEDKELGTNLKIFVNGQDKSGKGIRDSEKILKEYLPDINSNLLGSVIILGQGLPQRFTNNLPSGRKEILEKLSKSDFMIQDIKDKLSQREKQLDSDLRILEDTTLQLNTQLKTNTELLDTAEKDLREELDIKDFSDDLKNLEVSIKDNQNKYNNYEQELIKYKDELENLNNEHNIFYQDYIKQLNDFEKPYNEKLNDLESKSYDLKSKIDLLSSEIKRLKDIKDICPTCGQKLPNVHKVDTTEKENELNNLKNNLKLLLEEKENLNKKLEQDKTDFKNKFDIKLKDLDEKIKEKKNEISQEEKEISNINNDINRLKNEQNRINLIIENHQTNIEKLRKNLDKLKKGIDEKKEKILYNNIERDNKKNHQDLVKKMIIIATRDFRGFLLSEVIKFIDSNAKQYCQDIFKHGKINFYIDKNDIDIEYCGKEYESLSGGEKQKIDLIIQFSIRNMLCQFLNFSSNILALDEIFDNLDSIGCQEVINLISNKLTDIESIFIITHHADELSIPYDKEILVVKNEHGISEIQ